MTIILAAVTATLAAWGLAFIVSLFAIVLSSDEHKRMRVERKWKCGREVIRARRKMNARIRELECRS